MKERFIERSFTEDQMKLIRWADSALSEHQRAGYQMTLRQLYYTGVSSNLFPNELAEYKRLGNLIADARMAGWIDWNAIVDLGRSTQDHRYEDSAKSAMAKLIKNFRMNKWEDQPSYVEVLIEKQALEGIVLPACLKLEVPFTATKGYGSATLLYDLGKRLQERRHSGKAVHVIYGGDHDASGLDMTRDIKERLELFSYGTVYVHRVALNMDQVNHYKLPKNFAKTSDPRSNQYIEKYGDSSWEMDALPVNSLVKIFTSSVLAFRDASIWDTSFKRQEEQRDLLEGADFD